MKIIKLLINRKSDGDKSLNTILYSNKNIKKIRKREKNKLIYSI